MKPKKQVTVSDIRKALKLLNGSVANIRRNLKKRGIKGSPHDNEHCPIANYLERKFEPDYVDVDFSSANLVYYQDSNDDLTVTYDLTKPFREFIVRFDKGEFPELVEGGVDES